MGAVQAVVPLFLGRVLDADGDPVGTCFQVAPGVLATACHVLADVGADRPGAGVVVDRLAGGMPGFSATVHAVDELRDLAVLLAQGDLGASVPGLVPTDAVGLRVELEVFGVSQVPDAGVYRFLAATGTWQGPTMRDEQVPMGRLEARALMRGMSGAPVLRSGDQMVLGVVSGRYNAADGWLRDTGWVARTETLLHLLEGVSAPRVLLPVAGAPVELVLTVDATTVTLSGPHGQVTAGHSGIRPGLAAAVDGVRRARARVGAALRDSAAPAATAGAGKDVVPEPWAADYARLALGQAGQVLAESFLPEPVAGALGQALASARAGHQLLRLGVRAERLLRNRTRALDWPRWSDLLSGYA